MAILKKLRSAQAVLTLWYSLVIAGGIVVFGLSVYLYLGVLQERALENSLVEEADWIHQLVDLERKQGRSFGALSRDVERSIIDHFAGGMQNYIVVLSSSRGDLLYQSGRRMESIPLAVAPERDTTYMDAVDDPTLGRLRVAVRRTDPFIIQVAFPDRVSREVLSRLLTIFAVLTPVVLFLALAGGWFLTGTVLKPIGRITQTANRITAENLSERIPARDVDDELGELITTMNSMISRLQESFGQMRQFLMNVAHELKTPLTIMKGESELALSRQLSADETRELVSSHLRESVRMSRIVDDLLLLAKAEAGQLLMKRVPVSLDEVLTELAEDAQILGADKGHIVELTANPQVQIMGDAARIRQLFRILVTNAIQYTDPGGRIRIESRKEDGRVRVSVEDSGIGISPESMERIFERFYRTESARTRSQGGSGLGLPIARWIADSHHGTIEVESKVGVFSRFTVIFPIVSPPMGR
jgi:heavy metal sensor kinase